ncbi:hypothetical protein GCM10009678_81060 [Actinomadura kijaniata]|uniref:Uncharacterized protein n=1 Tax=Actinomadura namibiensis TaxID=182080 RepID=A0A7W3QPJ5_ACTNM|nr:hypothetical protein [Actinomadura namibiensis]MBA8954689.1 hypothetical protein [Actinomadura namibiensis]
MSFSPAIAVKRAAVVGGLGLAMGAGMLGTATAHADIHATGKPTKSFDVCLPKAAKCTGMSKVRVKGQVLFVPSNVRIHYSGYNRLKVRASLQYTIDLKTGRDIVKKVPFGAKLKPQTVATKVKAANIKKITFKVCKGTGNDCGKPQVVTPGRGVR